MVANCALDLAEALENERTLAAVKCHERDFTAGVCAVLGDKNADTDFDPAPQPRTYREVLASGGGKQG